MNALSDLDFARLYRRKLRPVPPFGPVQSPAWLGTWSANGLRFRATGTPPSDEALAYCPDLRPESEAGGPCLPADFDLLAGFMREPRKALATIAATGTPVVSAATLEARLAACLTCDAFTPTGRQGRGRCEHVACACSALALWHPAEKCHFERWPEAV